MGPDSWLQLVAKPGHESFMHSPGTAFHGAYAHRSEAFLVGMMTWKYSPDL
jgi:hypothetical protein